jgi:hypothetical protein
MTKVQIAAALQAIVRLQARHAARPRLAPLSRALTVVPADLGPSTKYTRYARQRGSHRISASVDSAAQNR